MSGTKKRVKSGGSSLPLPNDLLVKMLDLMIKSRVLEERLIKIYKAGESFFWIGAPGEEAFGVPLGLLINKGHGHAYDYLHLHYRCSPTLVAMGMPMIDSVRIMMNRATDTSTGGKNFSNHFCFPEWNVTPVSSPLTVQYAFAIGTAWAQKREGGNGISVITGGDAATAEGEFASSLIWSSRKGNELPMLITVQNNNWGISTDFASQHGEEFIADRGKAFGIRTAVIDGNDPIETYIRLKEEMEYIRKTRKPVLLEAKTSRLYGHSSATGANHTGDVCCIELFTKKLVDAGVITSEEVKEIWTNYETEAREAQELARTEPVPQPEDIWKHIFVNNENADWRKF
ncbi:MAG: thiamine pyrophosphate-dependent dehydrogenase E1 component subunit alpha [Bdellovibrionota bacterium]